MLFTANTIRLFDIGHEQELGPVPNNLEALFLVKSPDVCLLIRNDALNVNSVIEFLVKSPQMCQLFTSTSDNAPVNRSK